MLRQHAYVLEGRAAARHAFRVASGLDSMVLGEPQILGQMKQAMREAENAGTLGTTLHQMFQRSFAVAKEVRSSTEIGSHSISMAAATVRLASQLFEDLRDLKILFVGAGEMIELVSTHFAAKSPRSMVVANRTLERGERLASRLGGETMRLVDLPNRLAEFDVVISCTASSVPIIGLGAVERALKLRKHRPMFMVDLAVPRDIEPEVMQLSDIYLYTVDDLSAMVQTAGEKRQAAVEQAEAHHRNRCRRLRQLAGPAPHRAADPGPAGTDRRLARCRAGTCAQAAWPRAKMSTRCWKACPAGLTQKMMHGVMVELQANDSATRDQVAETVSRIFLRGKIGNSQN